MANTAEEKEKIYLSQKDHLIEQIRKANKYFSK